MVNKLSSSKHGVRIMDCVYFSREIHLTTRLRQTKLPIGINEPEANLTQPNLTHEISSQNQFQTSFNYE